MADSSLDEGAWERGKAHAGRVYRSSPFMVGTVILDALLGAVAVILTADPEADVGFRAAVTLLAILGGTVLAVLSVLAVQWAAAPVRQRNEARKQVRQLLDATPTAEALEAREREEDRQRELRVAVARVSEELELNSAILANSDRSFFKEHLLADVRWTEYGHRLADRGYTQAHRTARRAYRLIDEVNRSVTKRYGGEFAVVVIAAAIDEEKVREALGASEEALKALEAIPTAADDPAATELASRRRGA